MLCSRCGSKLDEGQYVTDLQDNSYCIECCTSKKSTNSQIENVDYCIDPQQERKNNSITNDILNNIIHDIYGRFTNSLYNSDNHIINNAVIDIINIIKSHKLQS